MKKRRYVIILILIFVMISIILFISKYAQVLEVNKIDKKNVSLNNLPLKEKTTDVTSIEYPIFNNNLYNIRENTSYADFMSKILEKDAKVYDKDNNLVTAGLIKTGMKITVNGKNYYNLIVKGDINGDGIIDIRDTVAMKLNIVELNKLTGAYLEATDTNLDLLPSKAIDLAKLVDYQIGILTSEEYYKLTYLSKKDITFTTNPAQGQWTNGNVTVTLSVNGLDTEREKIQYSVDGTTWKDGTTVIVSENNTTVYGRIIDGINLSELKTIVIKNIDKTKPTNTAPVLTATTNSVNVTSKQTDGESGIATIRYRIGTTSTNFGNWQTTGSFSGLKSKTTYYIQTEAMDMVGNRQESQIAKITTNEEEIDLDKTKAKSTEEAYGYYVYKDIVYDTEDDGDAMDLYIPDNLGGVREQNIVLHIHGGAFGWGSKGCVLDESGVHIDGPIVDGYIVADMDYTLMDTENPSVSKMNKILNDITKAIKKIKEEVEMKGYKPKKIALQRRICWGMAIIILFT